MPKAARQAASIEEEEIDDDEEVDRLELQDAYMFPILGSCVLSGLFFAFKYLDKDLVNKVLGGYFALMGIGALSRVRRMVFFVVLWRRIQGRAQGLAY